MTQEELQARQLAKEESKKVVLDLTQKKIGDTPLEAFDLVNKNYDDTHLGSRALSTTLPTTNQIIQWNGTSWVPATSSFLTTRVGCLVQVASDTSDAVAEGTFAMPIAADLNGLSLTDALANVYVSGTTGTMTIQIRRSRAGSDVDMLSTGITLGTASVYSSRNGVINASNKGVQTGDQIYVDVDTVHTTPAKGLSVALTFS